jgi:hypothetical protein
VVGVERLEFPACVRVCVCCMLTKNSCRIKVNHINGVTLAKNYCSTVATSKNVALQYFASVY